MRRHSGVLGLAALVGACPYSVPDWLPDVLDEMALHLHDPAPIQVCTYVCETGLGRGEKWWRGGGKDGRGEREGRRGREKEVKARSRVWKKGGVSGRGEYVII